MTDRQYNLPVDTAYALLQDCPQQLVDQVEDVVRFMKTTWALRGKESNVAEENEKK